MRGTFRIFHNFPVIGLESLISRIRPTNFTMSVVLPRLPCEIFRLFFSSILVDFALPCLGDLVNFHQILVNFKQFLSILVKLSSLKQVIQDKNT